MDEWASSRRRRRSHSAEFKAQVIQACAQPGVSVASVARAHGLNANLLRHWLRGRGVKQLTPPTPKSGRPATQPSPATIAGTFLPVQLTQGPASDIRLELRRGSSVVVVNWPLHDGAACGAWLLDWLR